MFDTDPTGWTFVTWALYVLAGLYVLGFLAFWVLFNAWERKAKVEGGEAVLRYNALLRGFPNAVYAKQFGKRAFEVAKADEPAAAR